MSNPTSMRARVLSALAVTTLVAAIVTPAGATFPYPAHGNPYDYTQLHIKNGNCMPLASGQSVPPGSDLPKGFDCRNNTKLTDYAPQPGDPDYDPLVENNAQELFGVKGAGTNHAWEITTGRPDTVIAITDSGIIWSRPEIANKVHLNFGELPIPCTGAPCVTERSSNWKDYDVNHDGVFNVQDYAHDPRVIDINHNGFIDGQDLIHSFSDGIDQDHNGYTDDIAGWDFYQNDNDPSDDVTYGHGSGEAADSSAEIEKSVTECPNCMFMPLRVGDSFIADINAFAQAVIYGVDNGISVLQEALGTINNSSYAQAAVDYAYHHGVVVDASEADEAAGHHNYPAALNHTMVVNSVTHYVNDGTSDLPAPFNSVAIQNPKTYLAFNGCTNFGGYTWVSVESNSCSSDATGQSSGISGLIYSAARNAVDKGVIKADASGRPLSAEEVKQIIRLSAGDIDFSTPKPPFGPPNNFFTTLPDSQRYITTAGWDQISGWGKLNANAAVRMVARGAIPPQADITSPTWWTPLGTTGTVDIVGSVSAPRAHDYTYQVEFAPGVQPPRWPLSDTWTTIATGAGTAAKTGVLAHLSLAQVRAAIAAAPPVYTPLDDPTSYSLPEKDAFRVRVIVKDDRADTGDAIEQRQYFSSSDPTLLPGWPKELPSDGAGSPTFADIDGDGHPELIVGTSDGWVHAFKPDGSEARGWPVHVNRLPIPTTGNNAYTRGEVSPVRYDAVLLGSPTVADLNGDGWPEISVTDYAGFLYAWNHDGTPVHGFPVQVNRAYSHVPGCETPGIGPNCDEFVAHPVRDHINVVNGAFTAQPAAGKIDPSYPGLDLIAGAEDGHVYAWHADGTPVPGWPVMLRDPKKVQSVDPVSHRITFKPGANAAYGRQVIAGVSLGDVNGDGIPEVAVNVDEEYNDPANWSLRDPTLAVLGQVAPPGDTRVYLLQHDGTNHPVAPGTTVVPNLGNNAYVPGWPAAIGMIQTELLPDVGSGSDGSPVFATMGGKPVIGTASIGSPPYLLNADGSSFYGNGPDGKYLTMASGLNEFKSLATDGPSIASLGGGVFGHIGGSNVPMSFAMGATGLRRLLDVVLPEQQLLAEDHVDAWELQTGTFMPGFPALMNDLQFFNTPIIADVSGDGNAEVITSSAMYDVRAYGLGGTVPTGWPKSTGGWSVATPAVADFNGDGKMELALMTRAGQLFVWKTDGAACQTREWPKYQHDLHNSGNYATDAEPPSVVGALQATHSGDSLVVSWRAPGDDDNCGTAKRYVVRVNGSPVTSGVPAPSAAGSTQTLTIPAANVRSVTVQAQDAAGNLGIPATVTLHGNNATMSRSAHSKASGGLATSPAARAAAKPAGVARGLLGGFGALVLLVGLTVRRRALR